MITRRSFVTAMIVAVGAVPSRADAQGRAKVPRVGYVGGATGPAEIFLKTLREFGYAQGDYLHIDVVAIGHTQRAQYRDIIAKFVAQRVDVIVATNPYSLEVATKATQAIPIVGLDLESDPVAKGWVASLARPGGNVTGIFLDIPEISGKQLQFLREAVPKLERVAILGDPQVNDLQFLATEAAAQALRLISHRLPVTRQTEIPAAVGEAARSRDGGLVALTSPLIFQSLQQVADASLKHRMPTICPFVPAFAEAGGLLAYGPVFLDLFRRMAGYVDKILKGARPAELPIQRPEKFELIVNLKTARALKLDLLQSLVLRADRVIE